MKYIAGMKIVVFLIVVLVSTMGFSQNYDLPSNPEPGKCYVKCYSDTKKKTKWDEIHCALVNYQTLKVAIENPEKELSKKDIKVIDKELVPFIKKGYKLHIRSHYTSSAPDSIQVKMSSQRAILIGNYLVKKGMDPDLLLINSLGSSKAKKIEIEYRIINVSLD